MRLGPQELVLILLIVLLLYMSNRSWFRVGVVLLAVPFSLIGAFWFLWLLGYNMSLAVWVGIIACLGLATESGVVMLVYLREAIGWIAAHPADWLWLQARKLFYLWVPIGPSYTLHSPLYYWGSVVPYLLLLPFASVGAWQIGRRTGRLGTLLLLALAFLTLLYVRRDSLAGLVHALPAGLLLAVLWQTSGESILILGCVLVFGGIWGFWGVLLAIPLLAIANTVCEHNDRWKPVAQLLGR